MMHCGQAVRSLIPTEVTAGAGTTERVGHKDLGLILLRMDSFVIPLTGVHKITHGEDPHQRKQRRPMGLHLDKDENSPTHTVLLLRSYHRPSFHKASANAGLRKNNKTDIPAKASSARRTWQLRVSQWVWKKPVYFYPCLFLACPPLDLSSIRPPPK